jgi:hypothetical protein
MPTICALQVGEAPINEPGHWDVMISYTQKSSAAKLLAEVIERELQQRGMKVWRDIMMDVCHQDAMKEAVTNSRAVIAVISGAVDGNDDKAYFKREYCIQELRWAFAANVLIVPVVDATDKDNIGELLKLAPEDFSDLGKTHDIIAFHHSSKGLRGASISTVLKRLPQGPAAGRCRCCCWRQRSRAGRAEKSERSGGWWAREEAQQAAAEAAYNAKVDAAWKEIEEMEVDKDGQPQQIKYWYNEVTDVSQWEKPDDNVRDDDVKKAGIDGSFELEPEPEPEPEPESASEPEPEPTHARQKNTRRKDGKQYTDVESRGRRSKKSSRAGGVKTGTRTTARQHGGRGRLVAGVVVLVCVILGLIWWRSCAGVDCGHGSCQRYVMGGRCDCDPAYSGSLCETHDPLAHCRQGTSADERVEYKGQIYRTLDKAPVVGASDAPPNEGCHREYWPDRANRMPLPAGYTLVPHNDDAKDVVANHGWSTACLVLADGTAWYTESSIHEAGAICDTNALKADGSHPPLYTVKRCRTRVLISCGGV